jgi:3-phosphoshikimate 1-carboxyvinyltransferase
MVNLSCKNRKISTEVSLTRSKSESNRALLLQAVFDGAITIKHLSDSDDTSVLQEALSSFQQKNTLNVGHAGTSFRFLTAFLAIQEKGEWLLTGSDRMKERPIGVLVDALRMMGASITYAEREGYPPLQITGGASLASTVEINAGVSSQYISALMLNGARLTNGLELKLLGKITSMPYLQMTISMMKEVGIAVTFDTEQGVVHIPATQDLENVTLTIEADWSAASYWLGFVALSDVGSEVVLSGLNPTSRQGDIKIVEYYRALGVESTYENDSWRIRKVGRPGVETLQLDLSDTPDVAQTLVCTCAGLGVGVRLKGLHTLRIKETDRLEALRIELEKFGVAVVILSDDELIMEPNQQLGSPNDSIATYKDHRMAMAFAQLALLVNVSIENEEVVTKSYPNFWEDVAEILNVKS